MAGPRPFDGLEVYALPMGKDDPLDAVQRAIVDTLVPVIADRIREEFAAEERERPKGAA